MAGRLGANTKQAGEILINGRKQELAYGTSAYVTQDETLITSLTVRETVYYSAQLQLPTSMSKSDKKERAEMIIKEMGLQESLDTRIGGSWGVKGLSGGQKRRVSICIHILTQPRLLFLDEPTSGLDSAASYHVMSRIKNLDQKERRTIIVSIHQPSSQVFMLFNSLCLLSTGKLVYFGPATAAIEFFASEGFPCPIMQNPPDHFLQVINKDFDEDIEEGSSYKIPAEEVTSMLAESYKSSGHFREVKRQIYAICEQARGALLAFVTSFLTFMAIGGFPSFVEDMKVFTMERLNGHYYSCAFVIANTLSSIPYLFLISLIPGAIAYYLTGLQTSFDHYLYFACVIFVAMLMVESLMMYVASLVPNFLIGIIVGAGIQGLMALCGGFFRLPNDLPGPFWKYPMYYISFHRYTFDGLYKNEFEGLSFPSSQNGSGVIDGETILRDFWELEMGFSKWGDLAVLFGIVFCYRFLFWGIIKIKENTKSMSFATIFVQAKDMTYISVNPAATPVSLHSTV